MSEGETDPRAMDDAQLAAHLAAYAGRILLDVRQAGVFSGKALGKAGDQTANQFLVRALRELRPDDGLLSEESKDTPDRLNRDRVWIIDPVDGTREYGEGRGDWAVHVGLSIGGVAEIGAVALPGRADDADKDAADGAGGAGGVVVRSDKPRSVPSAGAPLRMVVSRTRPAAEALAVAEKLGAELVPMGSAGAKAMAIILGDADIYLHSGGQYEWDSCAPVAVARAHGLHVSRIDGSPLVYNRPDVYLPDLLICRKEHAGPVLDMIAALAE